MSINISSFSNEIKSDFFTNSVEIKNLKKGFLTGHCFWLLHEKNLEFKTNIRGMVNYEYNRLLEQWQLMTHLIPGGEDLEQLGMDQSTLIIRPDLYMKSYKNVLTRYTQDTSFHLNLSTQNFFDLLHELNIKYHANIRGLINQRYNALLDENHSHAEKIPGGQDLEKLGIDTVTELQTDYYFQAYDEILSGFEKIPSELNNNAEKPQGLNQVIQCEYEKIYDIWFPNQRGVHPHQLQCPYYNYSSAEYIPNLNKVGDKALIARHANQFKQTRQVLKRSFKIALDAKFQLDGKPTNESIMVGKGEQDLRFYLKNNKGNLDSYEVIHAEEVIFCPEKKRMFCIKNKQQFVELTEQDSISRFVGSYFLGFICNGNRFEMVDHPKPRAAMDPRYWDYWWANPAIEDNPIKHYTTFIYPIITTVVLSMTKKLIKENKDLSPIIMDIGGGGGFLAEILVKDNAYPKNAKYIFLERSDKSLDCAKDILKDHEVDFFKTDLVVDELYGNILDSSVDIAIGSGILTSAVLESKDDALIVLRKVHRYLKSGGYLILTGFEKSFLESKDFEKEGFDMINYTATHRQLYIVKKR
jgi:SAM-dependent methyltransferase